MGGDAKQVKVGGGRLGEASAGGAGRQRDELEGQVFHLSCAARGSVPVHIIPCSVSSKG